MEQVNQFNPFILLSVITPLFFVLCLYFTLTFFQHLKSGDARRMKQAKIGTITSLAIGLFLPTLINLFFLF